jgi:FkbM family methyltransferase
MIRLNTPGILNQIGKKIAPPLSIALNRMGALGATALVASYLSLLTGRGAGTGWDKGEEAVAAETIADRLEGTPVVIDCGANRGEWTREVRRRLGSDEGTWVAVEPSPGCLPFLESFTNLEIIHAGVGEREELLRLYTNEGTSELASLHPRSDSMAQGREFAAIDVKIVTLDSIIGEKQLNKVDFLKMDLEGHELFALRGAVRALERRQIRALSFEFGIGNVNSRTFFRDFWNFLTPLGFELRRICPGGTTILVTEYYEDLEFFRGVTNYIAILK